MSEETSNASVSADDKNLAMLAHLLGTFLGFIPGLIIWLMNKDKPEKAFVNEQAKEALNFQITVLLAYIVSSFLMIIVIGFFLFLFLWIANIVFCIIATIAVNKGGHYRYPVALRLLK